MKWVLTVFETNTYHIFEFDTKEEAVEAQKNTEFPSVITFTYLSLVA